MSTKPGQVHHPDTAPSAFNMEFGLGIDYYFPLFMSALISLIPFAAGVWALVVLRRLQRGQEELLVRLTAIERRLRARDNQG